MLRVGDIGSDDAEYNWVARSWLLEKELLTRPTNRCFDCKIPDAVDLFCPESIA